MKCFSLAVQTKQMNIHPVCDPNLESSLLYLSTTPHSVFVLRLRTPQSVSQFPFGAEVKRDLHVFKSPCLHL